jgi:hypothetical protein
VEAWVPGAVIGGLSLGVAIRTAYRQHQTETLPHLHIQPLARGGRVAAAIHNGGKGLARSAFFFIVADQDALKGHIGTGFMTPGYEVLVTTTIPAPPPPGQDSIEGYVWCLDHKNVKRAWSMGGDSLVFRTRILRRKTYPNDAEVFEQFYGRSADEFQFTSHQLRLDRAP